MFLIGFLGIPSDHDFDFNIDVGSSTKPISITPYRMVLTNLNELKKQLQNFLSKGFARPSVFS